MLRHPVLLIAFTCLAAAGGQALAADCGRILVSGYGSTVHVYDACSGSFLRTLAPRAQLNGAQAIREHDGLLYVVAEGRGKVVRFDATTLDFVDEFISTAQAEGLTGIDLDSQGQAYVGAYNTGQIMRFSTSGAFTATVATGIAGPDNGMLFGPDGQLYIPAFDGDSVLRMNPASGQLSTFIQPGAGGLLRSRGILFETTGDGILITSEGSNQVLRYRRDGSFDRVFAELSRPTGIAYGEGGELLVSSFNQHRVVRLDPATGAQLGELVARNAGGLNGATFIHYQAGVPTELDVAQVGSQYWITGLGQPDGQRLQLEMSSDTGTTFGEEFDADAIVTRRWGTLTIEFTGCDAARLDWDATGPDSAGFGRGGYTLQRLIGTTVSARCNALGFANMEDSDWMAGTWYGGADRSGEGLMIDVAANGVVFVAFYTHRPQLD
jgi:DNA-binding beta-propeller fold protein YncE